MKPRLAFGLATIAVLLALRGAAVFIDLDPARAVAAPMLGPSLGHPLGTDQLGRDLTLRLIAASRAFVGPGLAACLVAGLISVPLGAVMGFWQDSLPARLGRGLVTLLGAWPRLVLVVVAVALFTASLSNPAAQVTVRIYMLAALVGLSFVPQFASAVAEKVLWFHREEFVEAARAHGLSDAAILGRHVLWANCRHLVLRQLCLLFGTFVLVETSLSYLGHYGVPEPHASWGNILAGVRSNVIHARSLLTPESWTPGGVVEAAARGISEGGLLSIVAPTAAIAVSIAGVLALASHFDERQAA